MEIEIVSRKENMVIGRTEVVFKAVHLNEKTPKRSEIKEKLVELLGVSKGNVIIDNMKPEFGRPESSGYAKVYKNIEDVKGLESDYILMRNNLLEKKAKEKKKPEEEGKEKEEVKPEQKKEEKTEKKGKKPEEEKTEVKWKKEEGKETEKTEKKEESGEKKKLKEEKSEKKDKKEEYKKPEEKEKTEVKEKKAERSEEKK
jgi:ribosomal protein S24E